MDVNMLWVTILITLIQKLIEYGIKVQTLQFNF